jgi:hypothetical protein
MDLCLILEGETRRIKKSELMIGCCRRYFFHKSHLMNQLARILVLLLISITLAQNSQAKDSTLQDGYKFSSYLQTNGTIPPENTALSIGVSIAIVICCCCTCFLTIGIIIVVVLCIGVSSVLAFFSPCLVACGCGACAGMVGGATAGVIGGAVGGTTGGIVGGRNV